MGPPALQRIRLLRAVDALHGPEVRHRLGERPALVCLQGADEVPFYAAWEEGGFVGEFLRVVFAEVEVQREGAGGGACAGGGMRGALASRVGWLAGRGRRGDEGEDVGGGLELGHGNKADLWGGKDELVGVGWGQGKGKARDASYGTAGGVCGFDFLEGVGEIGCEVGSAGGIYFHFVFLGAVCGHVGLVTQLRGSPDVRVIIKAPITRLNCFLIDGVHAATRPGSWLWPRIGILKPQSATTA